jgi:hypothetical protein
MKTHHPPEGAGFHQRQLLIVGPPLELVSAMIEPS